MTVMRLALLAAAFAVGTYAGWWLVPIAAAAWGASSGRRHAAAEAAVGALVAWAALLAWQARLPGYGRLTTRAAGVFGVPEWALVVATLLFAALLAATAASLGRGVAGPRRRPSAGGSA